jgi:hypothetical protein
MIREIKSYRWGQGDKPKKADDHALDELRYYLMNKPCLPVYKESKSILQKDFERLCKRKKNERNFR